MKTLINSGILFLFMLCFFSCNEELIDIADPPPQELIEVNSPLFTELSEMVNTVRTDQEREFPCLNFIYSFAIYIYDSEQDFQRLEIIRNRENFSTVLQSLGENEHLGINYPISGTLKDGTSFSIENNTDLQLALNNCTSENIKELLGNSPSSSPCIWIVQASEDGDNTYEGAIFELDLDRGLAHFYHNGIQYEATWTIFFVSGESENPLETKFRVNLHINDDGQIAEDWNFDWIISDTSEGVFELTNEENIIVLNKQCEYEIGDIGPAGGIVFYDKGEFTDGWRYLQAAPEDFSNAQWGCYGSAITDARLTDIGSGFDNTSAIALFHNNLQGFDENPELCSQQNDGSVAAWICLNFENNGIRRGWFLPSSEEAMLMYENLHLNGIGNFEKALYWTSTEEDEWSAISINFSNGNPDVSDKTISTELTGVRGVRYF
ncbi:hypothetical protein GWK08_06100 [Leptobacterium flavescens]|uniref:DUF1566 domain-containing protein n=1 Tax=Leptobacterium flavescens TaxID=472055 RepID=A0A6P0UQ36_9FLAO|nr:DUF1566 domain-containing protein [Leptobacterium flavescens]NER13003.1 hypothetical protein [Leptobacterium flavescens]